MTPLSLSSGLNHSIILGQGRKNCLLAIGDKAVTQSHGQYKNKNTLVELIHFPAKAAWAVSNSCFYRNKLGLYGWGCDDPSLFGERPENFNPNRRSIEFLRGKKVIDVKGGKDFALFLTTDGLYSSGANEFSQRGLSPSKGEMPTKMEIEGITSIGAGPLNGFAFTRSGEVYWWGPSPFQDSHVIRERSYFPTPLKQELFNYEMIQHIGAGRFGSIFLT